MGILISVLLEASGRREGTNREGGEESGSFRLAAPAALVEGRERDERWLNASTSKTYGSGAPTRPEPRTHPKQHHTHGSPDTPPPRTAANQPRLEVSGRAGARSPGKLRRQEA
ncbi:hypothetical protein Q8A73_003326 [Channa argus]|nr:hypothetical protein Q8A73_003326 [Channa argus]